jgi:hypothetical protein
VTAAADFRAIFPGENPVFEPGDVVGWRLSWLRGQVVADEGVDTVLVLWDDRTAPERAARQDLCPAPRGDQW